MGLSSFALLILSFPMAWYLLRRRELRVPPAFGWWLLFMVWVVMSGAMLGLTAPDTLPGSFFGRVPGFTLRLLNYTAATVAMLFVLNLPARAISVARLVRLQAFFFIVVVAGGLIGTIAGDLAFTSPVELLLPRSITSARFAESLLHPSLAQVQDVLGYAAPRPAAPFAYTNIWGNVLSLVLVWFVIAWGVWGSTGRRIVCGLVLALSFIPIIYSLNRGMWLGLFFAICYVCVRAALHGRVALLLGVSSGLIVAALVFLVSPLYGVVQERFANPHSNEARGNTSAAAVTAAMSSPILGYGSTRPVVGSDQSIAVGRSADCPQCGNAAIGGAGQLWLLLIAQGFVGAVLYIGFFVRTIVTYIRDTSAVAVGGVLVLLLSLLYLPFYGSAGMPLFFYLLAVAVLARQRDEDEAATLTEARPA